MGVPHDERGVEREVEEAQGAGRVWSVDGLAAGGCGPHRPVPLVSHLPDHRGPEGGNQPGGRCQFCGRVEQNCFYAIDLAGCPGSQRKSAYSADQFLTLPVAKVAMAPKDRPATVPNAFDAFSDFYYDSVHQPSKIGICPLDEKGKKSTFFGTFVIGSTCLRRFCIAFRSQNIPLELMHTSTLLRDKGQEWDRSVEEDRVLSYLQEVSDLEDATRDPKNKVEVAFPSCCPSFGTRWIRALTTIALVTYQKIRLEATWVGTRCPCSRERIPPPPPPPQERGGYRTTIASEQPDRRAKEKKGRKSAACKVDGKKRKPPPEAGRKGSKARPQGRGQRRGGRGGRARKQRE